MSSVPEKPKTGNETLTRARSLSRTADLKDLSSLFKLAKDGKRGELANRLDRIAALLTSEEHNVRIQTERLLLEQEYGKPRQALEHTGRTERVNYVVEVPSDETKDQWLARHAAARTAADEIETGEGGKAN